MGGDGGHSTGDTGLKKRAAGSSEGIDRKGREGVVALYIREGIDFEELPLRNSHVKVESWWVRVNKGQLVLYWGVCYRPPGQGDGEALLCR